jgi:acyl-CoA synthetase (AMP-forming)/AMP-acid ligase II
MLLVPAFVHMMLHSPQFPRADLSSLDSVACGAAYLPGELRQRFSSRVTIPWWIESALQSSFGLLSGVVRLHFSLQHSVCPNWYVSLLLVLCSQRVCNNTPQTGAGLMAAPPGIFGGVVDPLPGSMILVPNFEGRVVRDDGTDTHYDESGELWLRSEAIALGYWHNKQATEDTFLPNGWMRTGDRFRMDKEGRF